MAIPPYLMMLIPLVAVRLRRRMIGRFRRTGAVSPDTATSPATIGVSASPLLALMKRRGVVVEMADGRLYLDEEREREVAALRRRTALLVGTIAVIVVAVIWYVSSGR